jgi:MFS family permease
VRNQLQMEPDDPNVPLFSGLLAAAYLFGQFVCSPLYGALSERVGRRPVLLACVLISAVFLLGFGFSRSYLLSVVLRLMQGAFAGALTVGKLYLADVADASNEGRLFSFIGIAIGSGCIAGPAIGGYLADPSLFAAVPEETWLGEVIRAYPYLAPCVAGSAVSMAIFVFALLLLPESRPPPLRLGSLGSFAKPLLGGGPKGATPKLQAGSSSLPTTASATTPELLHAGKASSTLQDAMTAHASRSSSIVWDDGEAGGLDGTPRAPSPMPYNSPDSPVPVNAVNLALKYATSPQLGRRSIFSRSPSPSIAIKVSGRRFDSLDDELSESDSQRIFWLVQASCLLFTLANVGLTEVLPVWLSTPVATSEDDLGSSGLGLTPAVIGNLQSTTGVGNIVLALFVTFRIIAALGPVRTFAISLFINAAAAFGPPIVQMLPESAPQSIALSLMCVSYSLVAASRNMMFATAMMLSKEAATGAPGVAIGINQSACSLGSALGPMLTGFAYTQSLTLLRNCAPFFIGVGIIGALPGVLIMTFAPPWPWRKPDAY